MTPSSIKINKNNITFELSLKAHSLRHHDQSKSRADEESEAQDHNMLHYVLRDQMRFQFMVYRTSAQME